MSHNHKYKPLSWMDIAGVLHSAAGMLARFTRWSNGVFNGSQARMEQLTHDLNAQRLENLRLDAQWKTHRAAKESNHVVMTDARAELDRAKMQQQILKLELQNLELRRKLEAMGAFTPDFKAQGYTDPGDVRRGKMYDTPDAK